MSFIVSSHRHVVTPNLISGLTGWWKADDIALADGASVSQWNDSSGNNRHFVQSTPTRRPTFQTNEINGLPAVHFDGSNRVMVTSSPLSSFITAAAYTTFAVFRTSGINTNSATTWANDPLLVDGGGYWGIYLRSAPEIAAYNWDGSDDRVLSSISLNQTILAVTRHANGSLYLAKNGGSEASVASGDTEDLTWVLGMGGSATTEDYVGDVAEIVIYNVSLNTADRSAITNYLQNKWAIT